MSIFIFVQKPKDLLKIAYGTILLVIFGLFPILVAMIGGYFEEIKTGHPVNEGNSAIVSFGWLAFLTLPIAFIIFIPWMVLCVINIIHFLRNIK